MSHTLPTPAAILFDLDGTLVDSAPDLCGVANELRESKQLAPLPYTDLRPYASKGVRGLLGAAFGITPEHADYAVLSEHFLQRYAERLALHSRPFEGIALVIAELRQRNLPWGVVTNKARRFTVPLLDALGLLPMAACVVCGDDVAHIKPAPDAVLLAAQQIGCAPQACWFVGDDLRDIQAGHAAGSIGIAAAWGYIDPAVPIAHWQADCILDTPQQLLALLPT